MGHYSATDLVLGGFSLYWVIRGFWVGLSGELFSLAGLVAGIFVAFQGGASLASLILRQSWAPQIAEEILSVICGLALFITCNLLSTIIGRTTRKGLRAANLGGVDRLLGAVGGGFKSLVLVLFLYGFIHLVSGEVPPVWVQNSRLMNTVGPAWPAMSQKLVEWKLLDLRKFPSYSGEEKP